MPCIVSILWDSGFTDTRVLQIGYSTEWIIILFITGLLIREYSLEISKIKSNILVLVVILASLSSLAAEFILKFHAIRFAAYTSPLVIVESLALFILISRIKVDNVFIQKILRFVSPLSFGVYILDTSVVFYGYFLKDLFKNITIDHYHILTLVIVLLCSLLFFTIFILINFVRAKIFEFLGINKLINKISEFLEMTMSKMNL